MSRLAGPDHLASLEDGSRNRSRATRRDRWADRLDPQHAVWVTSALLALLILGSIPAFLTIDSLHSLNPNTPTPPGIEVFLSLGQLFGALVLALSSRDPVQPGLRWVAMGLFVLGTGALTFGYLFPLMGVDLDANLTMYSAGSARSVATGLIAIGLVPNNPPPLHRRGVFAIIVACGLFSLLLLTIRDEIPELSTTSAWLQELEDGSYRIYPGLTWRHTILGLGSIGMSCLAMWGAVRQIQRHAISGWLLIGLVFFTGGQFHSLFWPSMYSTVMSSTTVLRFGWVLIVVLGAVLELYALSRERSALLAREQVRVRQLEELGAMKRDFTSMVAHELGTPLAAIGHLGQIITMGVLPAEEQQKLAGRIVDETRLLQLLVRDVQESNTIERDEFSVNLQRVSVRDLLEGAYAYAETVRRDNPLSLEIASDADVSVIADPARIGQVIRNFINNAVRHTKAGTPISLHAEREGDRIRIAVVDRGSGILDEDRARILEKFGRGSTVTADGTGLGLYLSQRILRAHGSDIMIESEPGHGSSFGFLLERSR